MFALLANNFEWRRPQLLYEKAFWKSELREGSFCKLLMTVRLAWALRAA